MAALSLDALSSVAYGPEAIVIVLAAAGSQGLGFTLPVTVAIVVLHGERALLRVLVLARITAVDLYGVAEYAKVMIAPTVVFVAAIAAVVLAGLLREQPATAPAHPTGSATAAVGAVLLLRASRPTPPSEGCPSWPRAWPRTTTCRTSSHCAPTGRSTVTT
ncbi:hypothetical protein [Nonomuraea pusilla]|uniref:Uncharacterized protein n=1 Tax=Nonomuraea pusilla TaxID=46177 RepID=A0A1H7QMJ7_9ACTN|nr:hypothetical protein [Nonomuraea pusilla]SEL49173.1 hypothetical protein SAMN05660976_02613 [Nonomuraea pusilla]